MKSRSVWKQFVAVQVILSVTFGLACFLGGAQVRLTTAHEFLGIERFQPIEIPRQTPLRIHPNYNRPDLVSDEDLAAVLQQVQPPFDRHQMHPNHVEHALRTWGVDATFQNPTIVSGREMLEFLTDNAKFVESWGTETAPLVEERPTGLAIHFGPEQGASFHHDHWIACITEAGAPLSTPVYGPSRVNHTLYNVIEESLRDFRLDERETEWSAMAFGLWISPTQEWIGSGGRHYSFDLISHRLMRGERQAGVFAGTHRVYSLMLLIRLDDDFRILSADVRREVTEYLEAVRDSITAAQLPDGHWPSNWPDGAAAAVNPIEEDLSKQVIATGHHLEWLSIAPPDLLPPEPQIKLAMDWAIRTTKERSHAEIRKNYTFFSHIGSALANWRQVRPADFWRQWENAHPFEPSSEAARAAPPLDPADSPEASN